MQLLHHVIRPAGNRDDCDEVGEALHLLADTLEIWCPRHAINVDYAEGKLTVRTWAEVLSTLEQIELTKNTQHATAIDRIRELAGAETTTLC